MFRSLTPFQQSLIKDYIKLADAVYFHGIDQNVLPVISYDDMNGRRKPFAIRPRAIGTVQFSSKDKSRVPRESTIMEVAHPVRWFTDEELDFIDPDSHELLSRLTREYAT